MENTNQINTQNKEEFKKIINIWKQIFHDSRTKPTFTQDVSYPERKHKIPGGLKAEHFMFYNLLRDKPLSQGFLPESEGYKLAFEKLNRAKQKPQYYSSFFMPFLDHFTREEIAKILEKI